MRLGVTVGKFYPYHRGHQHLLLEASRDCDLLCVLIAPVSGEVWDVEERARWIREDETLGAKIDVVIVRTDLPEAPEPWAVETVSLCLDRYGKSPDVAYTSDSYGGGWAEAMGAEWCQIDSERGATAEGGPISGTRIRENLSREWGLLAESTQRALSERVVESTAESDLDRDTGGEVLRIVVTGAESSGKTTLARELAKRLGTVWAPEFGRLWWEAKETASDPESALRGGGWGVEDFVAIAGGQTQLEESLSGVARGGVLLCDTDPAITALWGRRYLLEEVAATRGGPEYLLEADIAGADAELRAVWELAERRRGALYIHCANEIGYVDDGTRESRAWQDVMAGWVREWLESQEQSGVRVCYVSGSVDDRCETALSAIATLLGDAVRQGLSRA